MGLHFRAYAFWGVVVPEVREDKLREWLGAGEFVEWDGLVERAAREKGIYLVTMNGGGAIVSPLKPCSVDHECTQPVELPEPDAAAVIAFYDALTGLGLGAYRHEAGWYLMPEVS